MLSIHHADDFELWREAAACAEAGVDFFASPDDDVTNARAKELCLTCPVADECLAFAIETNQSEGMWGGTTAPERLKLRRLWLREMKTAS